MSYGKQIRIFLIEGEAKGRWKCELSNWTGMAYKIPRDMVDMSKDREDLQHPGVYLLLGKDDDGTDNVYVGEAENTHQRLRQHLPPTKYYSDDLWTECIAFVSKDENLNKAQVKFLESKVYDMVKAAKRYHILNGNCPPCPQLSEGDSAEMQEFLDNMALMVGTLGHKVMEPLISNEHKDDVIFEIKRDALGIYARGMPTSDGFVVLKGSKVRNGTVKSIMASNLKRREALFASGVIDEDCTFTQDYLFQSCSGASMIVLGGEHNGWLDWKTPDGVTLNDYANALQSTHDSVEQP